MSDPPMTVSQTPQPESPTPQTSPPGGPAPDPHAAAGGAASAPADGSSGRVGSYFLRLFLLLLLVGVVLIALFFGAVRHWVALHTGTLHGGPDVYYNFWSGFGSDLGEATLISAVAIGVYTGVRRVNCHTKGCWRIGHHALDGTPYILCRHHHPGVPSAGASHEHILEQHRKAMAARKAEHA